MKSYTAQMVVEDLATILRDFEGHEYSGPIDAETRFFGDLGLASIHAVVLQEILETKYGRSFPFHAAFAELAQSGRDDLKIGELAEFLSRCMAETGTEA